ncbi:MAG: co-chaperone GroES [Chloroflexi bacterium]|nr:MAG: co-chaperone GroES [Chloroflexota bacterium]
MPTRKDDAKGQGSSKTAARPRAPRAKKASATPEIRLTGDRIVVRVPENGERRTSGGLLIPATAMPAPKRLAWGDVTLIGPEVRVAKEGDRVLFLPSAGLEVELDGEDLVLLRERDVQAVSSQPAGSKDRAPGQYL